jgi:hypothetical protein
MSAYGGKGPMTNAILWLEVVIFALFVALRLYTRKEILNSVGADDYLAVLALVRTERLTLKVDPQTDSYRSYISFIPFSSR